MELSLRSTSCEVKPEDGKLARSAFSVLLRTSRTTSSSSTPPRCPGAASSCASRRFPSSTLGHDALPIGPLEKPWMPGGSSLGSLSTLLMYTSSPVDTSPTTRLKSWYWLQSRPSAYSIGLSLDCRNPVTSSPLLRGSCLVCSGESPLVGCLCVLVCVFGGGGFYGSRCVTPTCTCCEPTAPEGETAHRPEGFPIPLREHEAQGRQTGSGRIAPGNGRG
mmetsp:Transcript_30426/g.72396  ORF Transcript_30426/g.72396 Transcript_30426/m.72396 type:complete len:219 (+) Transcript_30426:3-659(+)